MDRVGVCQLSHQREIMSSGSSSDQREVRARAISRCKKKSPAKEDDAIHTKVLRGHLGTLSAQNLAYVWYRILLSPEVEKATVAWLWPNGGG